MALRHLKDLPTDGMTGQWGFSVTEKVDIYLSIKVLNIKIDCSTSNHCGMGL